MVLTSTTSPVRSSTTSCIESLYTGFVGTEGTGEVGAGTAAGVWLLGLAAWRCRLRCIFTLSWCERWNWRRKAVRSSASKATFFFPIYLLGMTLVVPAADLSLEFPLVLQRPLQLLL